MISLLFLICASIAWAVIDTLSHHYFVSVFNGLDRMFWNPEISWKNKYKENLRDPKFFGSTSFLVWTTDAFHLFKSISIVCFILAVVSYRGFTAYWLLDLAIYGAAFNSVFTLFYHRLLLR